MTTTVFKNEQKISTQEVINEFRKHLEKDHSEAFEKSEIESLVEIASKNPTDIFTIKDCPNSVVPQGDILIYSSLTNWFKEVRPIITNLTETTRTVLQDGDSMTGDHRLIPLSNSNLKIQTGKFVPPILKGKNSWGDRTYDCKLISIDTPFLIFHREHGNLTLPAGEYIVCSSMNSETLERMMD